MFTDRVIESSNAVASVRLSVRLYILRRLNRLTFDFDLLHVSRSSPWLMGDLRSMWSRSRSRSRSWIRLMRLVCPCSKAVCFLVWHHNKRLHRRLQYRLYNNTAVHRLTAATVVHSAMIVWRDCLSIKSWSVQCADRLAGRKRARNIDHSSASHGRTSMIYRLMFLHRYLASARLSLCVMVSRPTNRSRWVHNKRVTYV